MVALGGELFLMSEVPLYGVGCCWLLTLLGSVPLAGSLGGHLLFVFVYRPRLSDMRLLVGSSRAIFSPRGTSPEPTSLHPHNPESITSG